MLAKAQVPEVVPSRTKYGERPKDERRLMMRTCCGRYETSIPTKMKSDTAKLVGFGDDKLLQCGVSEAIMLFPPAGMAAVLEARLRGS